MTPPSICETEHCSSHEYMEKTMDRLEEIAAKLTEGQAQIMSVIKDVSRLSQRIEKLETNQDDIKKFMYKLGGLVAAIGFAAPLIISFIQKSG